MRSGLRGLPLLADLVDLVLPRRCAGCGAPGPALCAACGCPAPVQVAAGSLPVHAAAAYRGPVRAALVAYKERARADLRPPLADLLASAVRAALGDRPGHAVLLVPVPSSRAGVRRRGEDVVGRLAAAAARRVPGRPALGVAPVLRPVRAVLDSAGLSAAQRAVNLDRAFAAAAPPPGRWALVVDDICTTGATLTESARALRAAGWPVLAAAVVAATPHPSVAREGLADAHWPRARDAATVGLT